MIEVVNMCTASGPMVYIGRAMPGRLASPLGNPFKLRRDEDRENILQYYKNWLWLQMQVEESEAMKELRRLAERARTGDLQLACWCAPKACHGDVVKAAIEWLLERSAGRAGDK